MRKLSSLIVLVAIVGLLSSMTTFAYEGSGGVRGGGEVFGDALNPWFLENTSTVTYCIEVDSEHFHLPTTRIAAIVESALADWKSEFQSAKAAVSESVEPFGQIRVATQKFVLEQCRESTLVRFQFGALSNDQRSQYIPDPTQFIAEAVRTAYDKTNLKGQGFIYVAPDSGPFRPKGLKMADQPWSFQNGILLKRVLLHELGHVFGLSHSGNAYALMGQDYPENIVLKSTVEQMSKESPELLEKALSQIGVFGYKFPSEQEFCPSSSAAVLPGVLPVVFQPTFDQDRFFGFTPDLKCHKFLFSENHIEVYGSPAGGQNYKLLGKTVDSEPLWVAQSLLRIKLSKQQKVFQKLPDTAITTGYLDGPMSVTRQTLKSSYETTDGKKPGIVKSVFLPEQNPPEMEVVMDGQLFDVFQ